MKVEFFTNFIIFNIINIFTWVNIHGIMIKHSIFSCLIFFISNILVAQLSDVEFDKVCENEDLIILNEVMHISFVGEKVHLLRVRIEKEIEYMIVNNWGIKEINPFVLPEPLDEIYKPHNSRIRNANQLFDELNINEFSTSISGSNGETIELSPEFDILEKKVVTDKDVFGYMNKYSYSFTDLKKDDILKIRYDIDFPFRKNWYHLFSQRIFFHGRYPKKNFDLTLSHHQKLNFDTNFINHAQPEIKIKENKVSYHWQLQNLSGCLDETEAHPYKELPWFTFSAKPHELIYEEFNSFKQDFIPLWYFLAMYREGRLFSAVTDNEIGAKDKDNLLLEKIANKYIQMAPDDSIGIERLRYFQRWICDSTRYDNAYRYFNSDESYMHEHPGRELYGGAIREHNKEFIYASILPKLGNNYFTAYITDKRTGEISEKYFAPMYNNDFIFAGILNNNSFAYIIPKSDRNNYYCEELPFYYENVPVFLMHTYDYAGYKRNFNETVRTSITPGSGVKENYRKTNSLVKVNLNNNLLTFSTKVKLSGQFSTLTRFVYNDNPVDSTINPAYLSKVWEIGNLKSEAYYEIESSHFYFPFETVITAAHSNNEILQKTDENEIMINLNGWIKHIISKDIIIESRHTNFHPDFVGYDSYAYMLDFGQPVTIQTKPKEYNIDNALCGLIRERIF